MARYSKDTFDHDGDGRPGGSRKETDMANTPKKTSKPTVQQSEPVIEETIEPGLSPKERRAELNRQFAEADEKGQAAIIEETQAGLGVRGY